MTERAELKDSNTLACLLSSRDQFQHCLDLQANCCWTHPVSRPFKNYTHSSLPWVYTLRQWQWQILDRANQWVWVNLRLS